MSRFLPLAVLVLAGFLLSIKIDKPFIGQHDWNGVVYGQQAKNFLRFGYLPLKFGATLASFDVLSSDRKFSTHYTPVLPILISFSYRLFGISEWSTRLVAVVASLLSVFVVMLLGKELISTRAGVIAGVLMTITPMFVYYGRNPVHEIILLPFALIMFYSYICWRRSHEEKWWRLLLISAAAAMLIGWSGYYAAGLILVHGILFQPKHKFQFLQLLLAAAVLLILFLYHVSTLSSQAAGELQNIFFARLGGTSIGWVEFLVKESRYSINLFTASLLSLSLIGFFCCFRSRSILFALGIFGLAHVLIFRDAGWYHEYLLFPFLPFVVLTAAGAIEYLMRKFPDLRIKMLIVGLFFALIAKERLGYLQALLRSEYVRDVYEEAVEFAKQKRWENEKIPNERDVYFIFYADRENI